MRTTILILLWTSLAFADGGWTDCPVVKGKKIQAFVDVEAGITLREGKKHFTKLTLPDAESFNASKSVVTCKEGSVEIWTQAGFSCFSETYLLTYANGKLKYKSKSADDPCRTTFDQAEAALKKGDAMEAAKLAEDVMYPTHYISDDFGVEVLNVGHKQATTLFRKGEKEKAGKVAEAITSYASEGFEKCKDKCLAQYNDLGFFLDEAGQHLPASGILKQVVAVDPNRSVAWLNLGDATWALGKKDEAVKAYAEYAKRIPKEKQPPRVAERIAGTR